MISLIIFGLCAIFLLFILITYLLNKKFLLDVFANHSVIVYGAKGKGKDLLFQYVIKHRKKDYLSNIDYGYKGEHISIKDISIEPNTFENFINNNITKIPFNPNFEYKDIYLSDVGVFLPCQYDYLINKVYPSLSIDYALHRHFYASNIHCNTQNLERVYKGLREQADYFIKCNKTIKFFGLFFVKCTAYEKYNSAVNSLEPINKSLLNKYDKALVKQYYATNGDIRKFFVILKRKHIKYDTRYFKKVVFDC